MASMNFLSDRLREFLIRPRRKGMITETVPSILTNNCLAGFLYHDYWMRFMSPIINMQMSPGDFLSLCSQLDFYMEVDLEEEKAPDNTVFSELGGQRVDFPVGRLGDLTLYFQHYACFEEAREKWERRKKRLNKRQLYIILLVSHCTGEMMYHFERLPWANKLLLYEDIEKKIDGQPENVICMEGLKDSGRQWYDYCGMFSTKRFYEQIDFAKWFNEGIIQR